MHFDNILLRYNKYELSKLVGIINNILNHQECYLSSYDEFDLVNEFIEEKLKILRGSLTPRNVNLHRKNLLTNIKLYISKYMLQ